MSVGLFRINMYTLTLGMRDQDKADYIEALLTARFRSEWEAGYFQGLIDAEKTFKRSH